MKLFLLLLALFPSVSAVCDSSNSANVALTGTASGSSLFADDAQYAAVEAIDGITAGFNFFHSKNETDPWWKVDLGGTREINMLKVYGREDWDVQLTARKRQQGFEIQLKLAGAVVWTSGINTNLPALVETFTMNNIQADEVYYHIPNRETFLELMEVEVMGCEISGSGIGDPHFKTWTGEKYDFHGACDLVLLKDPAYGNVLGMDIHIRTKFTRQWSYISTAVLKIGDETLEVMGGHEVKYWINKIEGQDLSGGISGFPISRKKISSKSTQFEVDLKDGSVVLFRTFKDFVSVEVDRANYNNFAGSLGMMGNFHGEKIARDGRTVVNDSNAFGLEWQVLPSEPMLFHNVEGIQSPEKCLLPVQSEVRRRLRESSISVKDAEMACARVSEEDRDSCIFDVIATNDKDMAGAY